MAEPKLSSDVYTNATSAWHRYLSGLSPLRPALYRYCRRLTGNTWDADDLVQETLIRGFGILGFGQAEITDPRAYLLRIASNAWIDWQRRKAVEASALDQIAAASPQHAGPGHEDAAAVRDAGAVLMQNLAPQERAAVVLKDLFDMSLEECGRILGSSIGAIKAALHRGRSRLQDSQSRVAQLTRPKPRMNPSKALLDRFAQLYNARDMPGLVALMLDDGGIEMMGVEMEVGRKWFERKETGWFAHNFQALPDMRWQPIDYNGEPVVLVLTKRDGKDVLFSVMRLEAIDDRISRIRSYAFSPETLDEVANTLGLLRSPAMYSLLDLPRRGEGR
jgi:RNA polymerase sigma-70 factor, ECF subfamily